MSTTREQTQVFDQDEEPTDAPPPDEDPNPDDQVEVVVPEPPAAEEKSSTREYVVFQLAQPPDVWKELKRVEASSTDAAIRSLGEKALTDGAVYVATSARGWKPVPVKIEKTTNLKLGS